MKTMKNVFHGITFYQSAFDEKTGTTTRVLEVPSRVQDFNDTDDLSSWLAFLAAQRETHEEKAWKRRQAIVDEWRKTYSWDRKEAFSPSPETIDIAITDHCAMGCTYCYMDSTAKKKHAPENLVEAVINAFDVRPYQVALGGGEPVTHPRFPEILRAARGLGVVPNYTTSGYVIRDEVIDATNEVCGGVSLTFHAFKGIDWFVETYKKLRTRLKTALNVHVIADKDVANNLELLLSRASELGPLSIILLAYYPKVGRGSYAGIMPKHVFNAALPITLKRVMDAKWTVAFSEGLLPYFTSRKELGIDTRFATRSEGRFSAYVDPEGFLSESSFNPPWKSKEPDSEAITAFTGPKALQTAWNQLRMSRGPSYDRCNSCVYQNRCATPDMTHYLQCAYSEITGKKQPLTRRQQLNNEKHVIWNEVVEFENIHGREMTDEEKAGWRDRHNDAEEALENCNDDSIVEE